MNVTSRIDAVVWREEYAIGVAELDQQHRYLLHLIQQLNQLEHGWFAKLRHERRLHKLLEDFNEYAAFHFLTEEKLMQQHLSANAELAQHLASHRNYWQHIHDFKVRQEQEQIDVGAELLDFLTQWWLSHIQQTDFEFGQKLNQRGVF